MLSAAVAVLDAEGRAALTMRRVARKLGVEAASLYGHVRSKDDLIDGVLDLVLDGVQLPREDLDWRTALLHGFTSYRRTLTSHPAVPGLMTERSHTSAAQARLVARSIELLESSGLSTASAVRVHITLVAYTIGFVVQEVGRPPRMSASALASSATMQRAVKALLGTSVDDRFRAGLELILDGARD
ncbi:MAG TPA: TetR/AcrR family transcriptional regulator C-terminal domain-containing protein [Candidatus Dormibacteraeota bacterium]|nr:TetR/AcrR family transcriptional regulator C-terminal domain-containing protein [Candidatus Dormibacteraeota bacterium]